MNVKIIIFKTGKKINALIQKGEISQMPSMHEGWRFNFDKELRKLNEATGYILVAEESPGIVEGCMIFQILNKKIAYMSYIEVAPHNKTTTRKYDDVAGCLIAYAFKLSVIYGLGSYNSILKFNVSEQHKEDEIKLMALYSTKYKAVRIDNSTDMYIYDREGESLIERYLQ